MLRFSLISTSGGSCSGWSSHTSAVRHRRCSARRRSPKVCCLIGPHSSVGAPYAELSTDPKDVAVVRHGATAPAAQRAGGKLAVVAPLYDPMPVFFTAEAILKDAPHPNAAKLFVSWYLSKDWQSQTGI